MRRSPFLRASLLVFVVVGVAYAEPPGRLSGRFVRTSLDATSAPGPERPLPPRIITASLDPRDTEVLGGEIAPRPIHRSLEEFRDAPKAVEDSAVETTWGSDAPSAVPAVTPTSAAEPAPAPVDAPAMAAPAPTEAPAVAAPVPPAFGELECDCTRTGRQIRVTLDGSTVVPGSHAARIIRVEL